MPRKVLFIAACAALLLTVASRAPRAANAQQDRADRLREEFHQTYSLAPNGRVSLKNIAGDIRIVGWERNEVKVDAVKSAYAAERLTEARIEVDTGGDALRIRTEYPERRNMYFTDARGINDAERRRNSAATVEYTLSVPRAAIIGDIQSVSGDIALENLTGEMRVASVSGTVTGTKIDSAAEISLSSVSGAVEIKLERTGEGQQVQLNSVSGGVVLTLPSDANANVRANTVSGAVSNTFGLPVRVGRYVGRDFAGQIGQGGARVKLNSVSGTVELRRANDGRNQHPVTNLLSAGNREDDGDGDVPADVAAAQADYSRALQTAQQGLEQARREINAARTQLNAAQQTGDAEQRRAAERQLEEAQRQLRAQQDAMRSAQREISRNVRDSARVQADVARAQVEVSRVQADIARGMGDAEVYIGDNSPRLTERDERSFNVGNNPTVKLRTDDGAVVVGAWDQPQVKVVFVKRGVSQEELNTFTLSAEQNGNTIDARAVRKPRKDNGGVYNSNGTVGLEIWLPRNVQKLEANTADGRIVLEDVTGEIELKTGDGSVAVSRGGGRLQASTGDGRIGVNDFNGAANVKTGDGRISLSGDFTDLTASTGDGTITFLHNGNLNAVIEADAESLLNDGARIAGDNEERGVKRLTLGSGGKVFHFKTGDGRVYIQRK